MEVGTNEDTDQLWDEAERSIKMSSTENIDQLSLTQLELATKLNIFLQKKKKKKEFGDIFNKRKKSDTLATAIARREASKRRRLL